MTHLLLSDQDPPHIVEVSQDDFLLIDGQSYIRSLERVVNDDFLIISGGPPGPAGPQGPQGPAGPDLNEDAPTFTLIYENGLI